MPNRPKQVPRTIQNTLLRRSHIIPINPSLIATRTNQSVWCCSGVALVLLVSAAKSSAVPARWLLLTRKWQYVKEIYHLGD